MKPEERIATALHSSEPATALRSLVRDFSKEGRTKPQICGLLEQFVTSLRKKSDYQESDENLVLDVLDALTGYCHPDARLFAETDSD
jgi:hypothetical protein